MILSPQSCELIETNLANAYSALNQTLNWQLLGTDALTALCAEASHALHTIRSEIAYNAKSSSSPVRQSPQRVARTTSIDDL